MRAFEDARKPGRLDVNGVEWWACDPYPTWFRWEGETLRTDHAAWADEPPKDMTHVMAPEDCYGNNNHRGGCDGVIRGKWSGVGCDCGARWFCL